METGMQDTQPVNEFQQKASTVVPHQIQSLESRREHREESTRRIYRNR